MTSKIVVNNIETDTGISSVTLLSHVAGHDSTQNISGINSVTANSFHGTVHGSGANLTSLPAAQLTGTVADARFPATLPAASGANLTNLPAANLTGTLPAISGANLTGISAGISALNVWYLTTSFTGNADPVQNWAKYDLKGNTSGFGSDMTQSSGIWTFPSTGFWQVHCQAYAYGNTSTASYSIHTVISTNSGASYETNPRRSFSNVPNINGYWYTQNENTFYYDVTNTSTTRIKVIVDGSPPNIDTGGTFVRFIRLADT